MEFVEPNHVADIEFLFQVSGFGDARFSFFGVGGQAVFLLLEFRDLLIEVLQAQYNPARRKERDSGSNPADQRIKPAAIDRRRWAARIEKIDTRALRCGC